MSIPFFNLKIFDFFTNFSPITHSGASQAFHFNNTQCTVFPMVYYYKKNSVIENKSPVFLSDSTKHDIAAAYTVQKILVPHIKRNLCMRKIIYFTDGAKQNFKNKFQMINLINHVTDFGVQAEWHYHATVHGKAASDGVGAVFKREAARNSLSCKPADSILSSENFLNEVRIISKPLIHFFTAKKNMRRSLNGSKKDLMRLQRFHRYKRDMTHQI